MEKITKKNRAVSAARNGGVGKNAAFAACHAADEVYRFLNTSPAGLTEDQAEQSQAENGRNLITKGVRKSLGKRIFEAFINPFTAVLLVLAVVSLFTDVIWAAPGEKNAVTVIIIAVMVLISGVLRFVQETRSGNAAAKLNELIKTTACVERQGEGRQEIPMEEIAVGDRIHLSAGDLIPADVRITAAKDLFVSQSSLTGESEPVEKQASLPAQEMRGLESPCLAFMGSTVISGSAAAVAVAVGDDTVLGDMAKRLNVKPPKTSFEKGVNAVSWILIRFMLVMVPVVLFLNGFTKGDWMNAILFAISVAVGLTPEMLPMIVTTCLA